MGDLPSGKRVHNYGKSPCSIGKLTISTGPFSIVMLNCPEGKYPEIVGSTAFHMIS